MKIDTERFIVSGLYSLRELPLSKELIELIILSNNDFFYANDPSYEKYLEMARTYFRKKFKSDPNIYIQYRKIVNIITKYIDNITDKNDIISKYTLLLKMINDGILSQKELTRDSDLYLDCYDYYGLDAVIGNSCCRHQGSLIYDVLSNFTSVKRLAIGKDKNLIASHCILAIRDNEISKYLVLDSVKPFLYNPQKNFIIKQNNEDRYLKVNYSYTYYSDFNDLRTFYYFFNNLYLSHLNKEEYKYIKNVIKIKYFILNEMYKNSYKLLQEKIRPERENILSLLKK